MKKRTSSIFRHLSLIERALAVPLLVLCCSALTSSFSDVEVVSVAVAETRAERCSSGRWLKGYRGELLAKDLRMERGCKTLLYFTSEYCAPCKVLQAKLFSQQQFFTRSPEVTKVKLQIDGDWRERDLARKLGTTAVPAFYVVSLGPTGKAEVVKVALHRTNQTSGKMEVATIEEALATIKGGYEPEGRGESIALSGAVVPLG